MNIQGLSATCCDQQCETVNERPRDLFCTNTVAGAGAGDGAGAVIYTVTVASSTHDVHFTVSFTM